MDDQPIACTLGADDATARVAEWAALRSRVLGTETIAGGVRLWLPSDRRADAEDLARRESECCAFLDLHVEREGDRVRVDITSRNGDAMPVIAALAGTPCC